MSTENTTIALPETFKPEVFKGLIEQAPAIFENNKIRTDKAIKVGNDIIEAAKKEKAEFGKISDDTDLRMNNYLVNIRKATKEMNDQRSPITSMFTVVAKLYTGLENLIDVSKPETIPGEIQKFRNELATQKAKEAKEKEAAEAKRLAIEKEKIELITIIELKIKQSFLQYVESQQIKITSIFDNSSLETFELVKKDISEFTDVYPRQHCADFKPTISGIYNTTEAIDVLIREAKTKLFPELTKEFKETIEGLKEILTDKLPSKKAELEDAKRLLEASLEAERKAAEAKAAAEQASAADKARLEAEAAEAKRISDEAEAEKNKLQDAVNARAAEDEAKAAKLAQEAQEKAKSDSVIQSAAMIANTMFDSEVSNIPISTAQVREGYKINVKSSRGYQMIAAFYFEKEGKNETIDKLEKKTLGQMKTFAEKLAKDKDEKIDSIHLEYEEVFKAVAKKA